MRHAPVAQIFFVTRAPKQRITTRWSCGSQVHRRGFFGFGAGDVASLQKTAGEAVQRQRNKSDAPISLFAKLPPADTQIISEAFKDGRRRHPL